MCERNPLWDRALLLHERHCCALHGRSQSGEVSVRLKRTMLADGHTDGDHRGVLGAGPKTVDCAVVVNLDPTGALVANIGPVFSYYEFPHPMDERLDEEAGEALLDGPDAPQRGSRS